MDTDNTLRCVVCATDVGPGVSACPRCGEPRIRICRCSTLVSLDQRACPSCNRVLPRVLSLDVRARRRWKRRIAIAAAVLVALGGVSMFAWPRVLGARRLARLRTEGEAAAESGRAGDAVDRLSRYAAERPGDARAQALLAASYFALGEDAAGLQAAERAFQFDPDSPGTHLVLARYFARAGDPLQAVRHARQAAEPEARAVQARALVTLGRPVEACTEFERAIPAAPRDAALLLDAAQAHGTLADADWPHAAEHARRAAELVASALRESGGTDASSHALRLAAAETLLRDRTPAEAVRRLGPAPADRAPAAEWTRRTRLLVAAGAAAQASENLQSALTRNPSDVGAFVALARMHIDAGRPRDALTMADSGRRGAPDPAPEVHEVLGDAAAAAGDDALAERHYDAWARAAPRDPRPPRKSLALRMPGMFDAARRSALATAESGHAVRPEALSALDPDDRWRLVWEAQWADLDDRRADAAESLDRLVELHPQDPEVRALRIRRAFAVGGSPGGGPPPEAVAASLTDDPRASASDARVLVAEAFDRGLVHLALDTAAPFLERAPDDPVLVGLVARCLLALDRPAAARAAIDRAPADARSSCAALREVADALADAPVAGVRDVTVGEPPAAHAAQLIRAARIASVKGLAGEAADWFAQAREACDKDGRSLRPLAEALEDAGRFADAREAWDAVLLEEPADIEALVRGAIARIAAGDSRTTLAPRVESLRGRPDATADAVAIRGLYDAASDDVTGAAAGLADVRRVLAAEPERTALALAVARIEADTGDAAGAVRDARFVLRRRPSSSAARSILARALADAAAADLEAGRLAAALDLLEQLAALPPGAGDRRTRSPLGDLVPPPLPPGARDHVQHRIGMRPDGVGHRLVHALDLAARGQAGDAKAVVSAIVANDSELACALLVRALLRLGAGRPGGDVAADLDAAAARSAPAADVALVRAAAAEAGEPGSGRSILDAALAESPAHARLCAASGTPDDLVWLLANAPGELDVLGLHACAATIAADGDPATARRALRRALLIAPSGPGADRSAAALSKLR